MLPRLSYEFLYIWVAEYYFSMYNKTRDYRKVKKYSKILEYNRVTIIDIDGVLFFDPPIDSILKIKPDKLLVELNNLVIYNEYSREESERIYCDECLSTDIKKEFLCPRCQSLRIFKDIIILHSCGFRSTKKAFSYIDRLRCPHCKKELGREDEDYIIEGIKYICLDCTNIFDEPVIKYRCMNCRSMIGENPKKIRIMKFTRNL